MKRVLVLTALGLVPPGGTGCGSANTVGAVQEQDAGSSGGVGGGVGGSAATGGMGGGATGGAGGSASGGTAGAGGSGGAVSPPSRFGRVTIGLTDSSVSFFAAFDDDRGHSFPPYVCRYSVQGPCMIEDCADSPDVGVGADAGVLHLETTDGSVDVTFGSAGYEASQTDLQPLGLAPGVAVTVSAAGAVVPAFATSVVMPAPIVLNEPMADAVVDRTKPLPMAWRPRSSAVRLDVLPRGEAPVTFLFCELPAAPAMGVVPASALALAKPPGSASLSAYGVDTANVRTGDWLAHVSLVNAQPSVQLDATLE